MIYAYMQHVAPVVRLEVPENLLHSVSVYHGRGYCHLCLTVKDTRFPFRYSSPSTKRLTVSSNGSKKNRRMFLFINSTYTYVQ